MKIEITNLHIEFNNKSVLTEFDLAVKEGEFVTVLGHSGSGKTTLLNIIAGTVKPDKGAVSIDGDLVTKISDHVAYMPQDDLLLPWKNIIDNVTLYAKINGDLSKAREEALGQMEVFGLAGYETKYPRELSGGMRQRAAFLRTSMCKADIMLLDEPFASLDVITRAEMQNWLLDMRTKLNKTILMVTHDIDEAMLLSDRIVVISGTPAKISKQLTVKDIDKEAVRKEIIDEISSKNN